MDGEAKPRFTFDATFPDGSPRRLAGTWRPPTVTAEAIREVLARIHVLAYTPAQLTAWYQGGQFDRPLYYIEDDE